MQNQPRSTVLLVLAVAASLLTGGSAAQASTAGPVEAPLVPPAVAPGAAPVVAGVTAATSTAEGTPAGNPVPYRVRTFNLQSLSWDQLWTNGGPIVPYAAQGHKDADGIPMRKWIDGKYYYTPVKIELEGIVHLDSYVRTGNDPGYIPTLQKLDNKLRQLAVPSGGALFLPMPFDFNHGRLKAPWYNAMAQGYGLSFFVRMYRIFGDQGDLDMANALFRSFQILGPSTDPWVSQVVNGNLWLEHYPNGRFLEVLNAHMHALFGLYDYWQQVGTPDSLQVLDGAITTMRLDLHLFRRIGKTSRYCLVNPVYSLRYHRLHIRQVQQLALVTGDPYFTQFAQRLYWDAH